MSSATPRKPDRPVLWIVAGPNGSGKSTFYNRTDVEGWGGSIWIINPDLLTETIVEREGLLPAEANLAAVQRLERWLDSSIETYQTIGGGDGAVLAQIPAAGRKSAPARLSGEDDLGHPGVE